MHKLVTCWTLLGIDHSNWCGWHCCDLGAVSNCCNCGGRQHARVLSYRRTLAGHLHQVFCFLSREVIEHKDLPAIEDSQLALLWLPENQDVSSCQVWYPTYTTQEQLLSIKKN